jgi:hypothetical protein
LADPSSAVTRALVSQSCSHVAISYLQTDPSCDDPISCSDIQKRSLQTGCIRLSRGRRVQVLRRPDTHALSNVCAGGQTLFRVQPEGISRWSSRRPGSIADALSDVGHVALSDTSPFAVRNSHAYILKASELLRKLISLRTLILVGTEKSRSSHSAEKPFNGKRRGVKGSVNIYSCSVQVTRNQIAPVSAC